jgi:hypothetical protein
MLCCSNGQLARAGGGWLRSHEPLGALDDQMRGRPLSIAVQHSLDCFLADSRVELLPSTDHKRIAVATTSAQFVVTGVVFEMGIRPELAAYVEVFRDGVCCVIAGQRSGFDRVWSASRAPSSSQSLWIGHLRPATRPARGRGRRPGR